MAFTADSLLAAIDSAVGAGTTTGRTIQIDRFVDNGASASDIYCVGVSAPYANVAPKWVTVAQSNNAAQAATLVLAAFKP